MATSIYSSFLFEIHHHQNLITQVKERKPKNMHVT